ncbi:19649_t:CDS:2, partial [Entrophospora sp. SA101]
FMAELSRIANKIGRTLPEITFLNAAENNQIGRDALNFRLSDEDKKNSSIQPSIDINSL